MYDIFLCSIARIFENSLVGGVRADIQVGKNLICIVKKVFQRGRFCHYECNEEGSGSNKHNKNDP